MADLSSKAPSTLSLVELEEELTCSICLCVFESPVTTPCGHNFCLPCLEMTWGDQPGRFTCPQCRSAFDSRPELKKNTVLCRVVEQFRTKQEGEPQPKQPEGEEEEEKDPWATTITTTSSHPRPPGAGSAVTCDSCLAASAAKTCLTCMASFCGAHLMPHLESPAFLGHQLVPPVGDLQRRKCPTHHKLLEFFCQEHAACACCLCLVLLHKACATVPLREAKEAKEMEMKKRLMELYSLNKKSSQALDQVRSQQKQVKETINCKLDMVKSDFQEITALIQEEEKESVKKLLSEEERVHDKYEFVYKVLCKKKSEIQGEKEEIETTLTEDDDIMFLTKAAKLRPVPFKEVFIPKIGLDQYVVHKVCQNACDLKEHMKQFATQKKSEGSTQWKAKPQTQHSQPGKKNAAANASKGNDSPANPVQEKVAEDATLASDTTQPSSEEWALVPFSLDINSTLCRCPKALASSMDSPKVLSPLIIGDPVLKYAGIYHFDSHVTKSDASSLSSITEQRRRPAKCAQNPAQRARSTSTNRLQSHPGGSLETFLNKSREELLEYAVKFSLDFNTAHRKIILSERNTKVSVSDIPQNYSDHPQRFTHCSQVISFQAFKRGIHYWEVEMEHNSFCGIGICYGTMPRQGAESRLGRNSSSWCIEWFNAKISAWHNEVEKCLPNTKVKKVGVLLNYEGGFVIFFGIAEKITLLYKYQAQFTEALYAAFWIFSSGTTITLCPLK